jgi:hypothetical protein
VLMMLNLSRSFSKIKRRIQLENPFEDLEFHSIETTFMNINANRGYYLRTNSHLKEEQAIISCVERRIEP